MADTARIDSLLSEKGSDLIDSLLQVVDSAYMDSLEAFRHKFTDHTLYMFHEEDTVQKLLKAELLRKNTLQFSFSRLIPPFLDWILISGLVFVEKYSWDS